MKSFHMSLTPFQRVFGNIYDIFSADARSENGSVENDVFWSEIASGFRESGDKPH